MIEIATLDDILLVYTGTSQLKQFITFAMS